MDQPVGLLLWGLARPWSPNDEDFFSRCFHKNLLHFSRFLRMITTQLEGNENDREDCTLRETYWLIIKFSGAVVDIYSNRQYKKYRFSFVNNFAVFFIVDVFTKKMYFYTAGGKRTIKQQSNHKHNRGMLDRYWNIIIRLNSTLFLRTR